MIEADSVFEPIDLKKIGASYGIKHAPKFVYRWFERLLHTDEINSFVGEHWNDEAQDFLDNLVNRLDIHGEFNGKGFDEIKNLVGKQYIIVSNHPIGGAESTVCLAKLHAIDSKIKLLAGQLYSMIKPMAQSCVYNKQQIRTLYNSMGAGNPLLIYPAGACSRKLSFGDVFDYRWKKSFIKMARKGNAPIIVCFTSGQASNRYLNFTKVRKFFHIKTVLEASFLPDEMFRKSGSTIEYTFSKAIDPSVFTSDIDDQEWADRIRQYCYNLKSNPNAEFDPSAKATLPLE